MWHASLSFQRGGQLAAVDAWPSDLRRRLEREAKKLIAGVGAGPRRWEHGTPVRGRHVLHVRRSLSDAEIAGLADGPPATARGGDFGGLYRCCHVTP